jgi:hypothetical protein
MLGVDRYDGRCVAVEFGDDGGASARTALQFADLLDTEASVVAVDFPIGIPGEPPARQTPRSSASSPGPSGTHPIHDPRGRPYSRRVSPRPAR